MNVFILRLMNSSITMELPSIDGNILKLCTLPELCFHMRRGFGENLSGDRIHADSVTQDQKSLSGLTWLA